jgi:hypothetical protein
VHILLPSKIIVTASFDTLKWSEGEVQSRPSGTGKNCALFDVNFMQPESLQVSNGIAFLSKRECMGSILNVYKVYQKDWMDSSST